MLNEEQANKVMADIVWLSTDRDIWGNMLEHLYNLHKIRDRKIYEDLNWDGFADPDFAEMNYDS